MFIFSQKGWGGFAALALLVSFLSLQSFTAKVVDCNCPQVSNVAITHPTDGTVSLGWDAAAGATAYEVWYTRDDGHNSSKVLTSATSMDFSGLAPGTYDFHIVAVCGADASEIIILEEIILV